MTVAEAPALSRGAERIRESLARLPISSRVEVHDLDLPTLEVRPEDWTASPGSSATTPNAGTTSFSTSPRVDNLRRKGRPSRFEAVVHLRSLSRENHLRVKVILPDGAEPVAPFRARDLARGELVRAGGLGPHGLPVRRPPQPAPAAGPRCLRRAPAAQGLCARPALVLCRRRPPDARLGAGDRRALRPLRDADALDRPLPSRDARDHPPHRPARWRAHHARRDPDRLHAPLLREDVARRTPGTR